MTGEIEPIDGWELARADPGERGGAPPREGLDWRPARVPGTVAGALGDTGGGDLDGADWWFRARFVAAAAARGEEVVVQLGGLATLADVYLNGELVRQSDSMFAAHEVDVGDRLGGENELLICCRALSPRLVERRRPRARWRTRLVDAGNLRFYRTMLLGRAPGFAPGPAVAGPWRPVVLERRRGLTLDGLTLRARLSGGAGVVDCRGRVRALSGSSLPDRITVRVTGAGAAEVDELPVETGGGEFHRSIPVPDVARWWPHTHGDPTTYEVAVAAGSDALHRARVGFRTLEAAPDIATDGLDLRINGVPVFARGAVWTPLDLTSPHAPEGSLRRVLERVVDAGMNMLRIPGTAAYESDAFHDLCDELGILVWQDFMFANLDYPEADSAFMEAVADEARSLLRRLGPRPSLAVLCGGSEVAQQVGMLGLDPALADGPLFGELLPRVVAEASVDAPYIPSSPWGGELPFRTDRGIAHYFGVGAYRLPLEDARRAEVRFAAECLAFANVPDDAGLDELPAPARLAVGHPAWKAGVPRDVDAGWDFDDVRDHYLRVVFGVDPVDLRWVDPRRYLELSRAVSGEVMAETFGEWRRSSSPCHGGLVLWLKDLFPGAGWGVLDHRGAPKVAYHHLRRAFAPVAVWGTDEGLNGIAVHVANDRPHPLRARLRVSLYSDFRRLVDEAAETVEVNGHGTVTRTVEGMLGRFVDAAWAYGFGPPAHDLIVLSLEHGGDGDPALMSQSFRFPAGRPLSVASADELGLNATLVAGAGGAARVHITAARFVYGVRVDIPGYVAADDAFGVEPGHTRVVELAPTGDAEPASTGSLAALNLSGRARIQARP